MLQSVKFSAALRMRNCLLICSLTAAASNSPGHSYSRSRSHSQSQSQSHTALESLSSFDADYVDMA